MNLTKSKYDKIPDGGFEISIVVPVNYSSLNVGNIATDRFDSLVVAISDIQIGPPEAVHYANMSVKMINDTNNFTSLLLRVLGGSSFNIILKLYNNDDVYETYVINQCKIVGVTLSQLDRTNDNLSYKIVDITYDNVQLRKLSDGK